MIGRSSVEAEARPPQFGPNALPSVQRRKWLHTVRETLQEPMFMLLLAAGTLCLLLGDLHEGLVLFGLVLVVLAMTLYQEGRAERALDALRDLCSPRALVLRDGQPLRIAGHEVRVDESLLTGETMSCGQGGWAPWVTSPRRWSSKPQPCSGAGAWLAGIALAMARAMLPQEFTVVLTVLPALGAWRLSKKNVLTWRIAAIETLGTTSVRCVDKIGTLTENRMTVVELYAPEGAAAPAESMAVDDAHSPELPEAFHTLVEYSILASGRGFVCL